jgi:hypothetical protein
VSYDATPSTGRTYLFNKASRSAMAILIAAWLILACVWILGIGAASSIAVYGVTVLTSGLVFLAMVANTGLRPKAWLEGTTLTVRGAYTTHHCDLARAAVRLDADRTSGLPLLTARDTAGRSVRLVLREKRRREALEPQKLHALANAIMAGGPLDEAGSEVVGSLRSLAGGAAAIPPPPYQ